MFEGDELDDEHAAEVMVDLAAFELPTDPPPTRDVGGIRRTSIRLYTWVVERETNSVHHPQWITTGQGFSARAAVLEHNRYIRSYQHAVAHGTESRRLGVTMMEVVWWTAATGTRYV